MRKLIVTTLISMPLLLGAQSQSVPSSEPNHVFWYNCIENRYNISQNPGPNLSPDCIKHQGMVVSAKRRQSEGNQEPSFGLGNGPSNAGFCSFVWFKDLNNLQGKAVFAKVRGEYRDNYAGKPYCTPGPMHIRCGVVDYANNINDIWGDIESIPATATWMDHENPLYWSMNYSADTNKLAAEEIIDVTAPQGVTNDIDDAVLDKMFFEIDVTEQVNWILSHTFSNKGRLSGQYAIVFLTEMGDGTTGRVNLYSDESAARNITTANPWTNDGNTLHLVGQMNVNQIVNVKNTRYHMEVNIVTMANELVNNPVVILKPDSTEVVSTNLRKLISFDISIDSVLSAAFSSGTLCFNYSKIDISDLMAQAIRFYYLNGSVWDSVGGIVDTVAKTVTVAVSHFSTFGVFIPTNTTGSGLAHVQASAFMLSVAPNPFAVSAGIAFSLKSALMVDIAAYDIRGHLVKTLVNSAYPAGSHQIAFDGMNRESKPLSSGIYFIRMKAGNREMMKQVQIMR